MKLIIAFLGGLMLTACATTSDMGYNNNFAFNANNYALSSQLIQDKIEHEEYTEKDEVMYSLELGTIYHLQGDYDESNRQFTAAEDAIDENYTKSVSRGLASFISNDNTLVYDGEPYEDVYLNMFMALNYLHQNDLEGALVEARRIAYKLEQTAIKAKGMAEVIGSGESPVFKIVGQDQINYELGELTVQDSPFSHYLSTIVLTKMDKYDGARIEFDRFKKSVNLHAVQLLKPELNNIVNPSVQETESFNTVLVGFTGRAPKKVGKKDQIYLTLAGVDFVYAYPELEIFDPVVERLEVVIDGDTSVELPVIEHMDLVAAEVFNHKLPIIKTRALLRGAAKGALKDVAKNKAKKYGGALGGFATDLLGSAIADASEQADTRSWESLPGKVHAQVIQLDPGDHVLEWNYYDANGRLRYTKTEEVQVAEGKPLSLVQSQYLR